MPNLVAYNSGAPISNALQFGTIVMDVNNTVNRGSLLWCPDYGICNQYLIVTDSYTNGKTNQLTARAMGFQTSGLTNSDLIAGINKLASSKSAGPFGTLSDAINWAIYEGYFITNQEYPSIVTSGCVLNLDSNFPPSYPLVFNTWYDLTGNGNTGLLNNGITYNSALRGSLVLNGTNQYVSFSATTGIPVGNSNYTISTWFNPSSLGDKGLVGWGNYGSSNQVNALRLSSSGIVNYWWANDLNATYSFTTGNWYNAVATFNGTTRSIWVNGSLISSDTPVGHNVPSSTNLTVGVTNSTEFFGGNMGEVQIFDRALTSTEITKNYNALLPRYNGTYTDPCDIAPSCLYNCDGCIGTGWLPYDTTSCYRVVISAATAPVSTIPLIRRGAVEYSQLGTQFYDEGFSVGGTGTILQTSLTAPLWYNSPNNTVNGPMNRCAIWYSAYTITNTWLGFSTCLSGISTTNTYYVGIAADNEFKLILDGVTILNTTLGSMGAVDKFKYWHVYPVTIPSGNHTLELYGLDYGVIAGFGMEIYDNTLSELTGATTLNDLNVIFSSSGYTTADIVQTIGGEYLSSGYTCPSGFVYSTCSGNCIDYEYCYSTSPTSTPTPTPTTTPTITCACYSFTNTTETTGEVYYTSCLGNSPTTSSVNAGLTITFCAVYGQPVTSTPGTNGGLCAGFVQPCVDDSDCSACGSNTPTVTSTPTPTPTCPIPTLYLANTSSDACNQINGQLLTNISYTTTGTCSYCNYSTLNSTEIPGLTSGTYYVSDGTSVRGWTKSTTPSVLFNPTLCSSCGFVTPTPTSTPTPTPYPSLACGGFYSGVYAPLTSTIQQVNLDLTSTTNDSTIYLQFDSIDRPNRFNIYDSVSGLIYTSGWIGSPSSVPGPWNPPGTTPVSTNFLYDNTRTYYILIDIAADNITDAYTINLTCTPPPFATPTPTPTPSGGITCIQVIDTVIAPQPQTGLNNFFGVNVSLNPYPVTENVTVTGYIRDDGNISNTYNFSITIIGGTQSGETANNVLTTGPADTATIFVTGITPSTVTYNGNSVYICGLEPEPTPTPTRTPTSTPICTFYYANIYDDECVLVYENVVVSPNITPTINYYYRGSGLGDGTIVQFLSLTCNTATYFTTIIGGGSSSCPPPA